MKTVKVRIAVAVDPSGKWNASGWSEAADDEDMMGIVLEGVDTGERRYWLEAELEVPEPHVVTVSAAVADGSHCTVTEGQDA